MISNHHLTQPVSSPLRPLCRHNNRGGPRRCRRNRHEAELTQDFLPHFLDLLCPVDFVVLDLAVAYLPLLLEGANDRQGIVLELLQANRDSIRLLAS
jgi:hypothetical protein